MQLDAGRAEDGTALWREERGGRFEEEEGTGGPGVLEFRDVVSEI